MKYADFVTFVQPVLGKQASTELSARGCKLDQLEHATLRTALLHLLWREGQSKPIPVDDAVKALESFFRDGGRRAEPSHACRTRRIENLGNLRRAINSDFAAGAIACHIDLVPRRANKKLTAHSGFQLELDQTTVVMLRESDRVRSVARKTSGYRVVELEIVPPLPANETDRFELTLQSRLTGWLNLFLLAKDESSRLVPHLDTRPVEIIARKVYRLPQDIYTTACWKFNGKPGKHTVVAIVTKTPQPVMLAQAVEVKRKVYRGISVVPVSLWSLPKKEVAIGCRQFTIGEVLSG